jgi:hypothetical protein
VSDLSLPVADAALRERLTTHVDREGKIAAAMAGLGPIDGRQVVLLDADGGFRARQLGELGAVVTPVAGRVTSDRPARSSDVVASFWAGFEGVTPSTDLEVAEAERIARPGGRLLVAHDYGRDDVSHLLADADRERASSAWSARLAWFLSHGFKIKVLHAWWTFDSLDDARELLVAAFDDRGAAVAGAMSRPRLAYKVALFHRTLGVAAATDPPPSAG